MGQYIFAKRNLIHIIDIRETVKGLLRAKKFISQIVARGDDVLFVGTKRQARDSVVHHATSIGMPYVSERWLGGTLTNFRTIRSRLTRLAELEALEADGRASEFGKKQASRNTRERRKIARNLSGIREMSKLPGALVVIDVQREHLAVREARTMGIPTVCLIDTDSDPDFADIPIPGNDDAMRSIETILEHMVASVREGMRARTTAAEEKAAAEKETGRRSERASARVDDGAGGGSAGKPHVDASPPGGASDGTATVTATDVAAADATATPEAGG